ncbi:MAG: hypothetical protein A2513_06250 [Sulfurimonas sp. RIFOXYD12_FULL_33_39]|uniref:HoxN/HupN/NixA family nickel/cobalt transporter n=1 Tax=unclassified Sulfurimonas TaxID=2623549 RepID=UPI0008D017AD|nr:MULTISPECIES: DUF1007 family protein [unclassified Sulfurimonas]OHE10457.1 MAG: hypothetical protein A2513_06250 [Sulfurimonas sp. RIFOXYD12_FULL_33_39]OHE14916.1 MAG: hypothetical protein A2530_00440 [Sulfurimonas sp. RIFOXYD2_FULL_34_21]
MKKLFLLLFFTSYLFGCATCQLMIPMAEVKIDITAENKKVTNIRMEWGFSDLYTSEIVTQYDKNKNTLLDKDELEVILKAKLDYLLPKKMLTQIKYAKHNQDAIEITPKYQNFTLVMQNKRLVFFYDTTINLDIDDKAMLSFVFEDDESYFGFVVTKLSIAKSGLYHTKNLYLFSASLLFSHTPLKEEESIQPKEKPISKEKTEIKETSFEENILQESISKIKSLFTSIKDEKNPLTYIALLFFAYTYGLIHALGPGHGKTIVASYFLSNDKSYSKALFISLAIGIVHTFSAFLLTLFIYFIVDTFLAQFMDNAVFYTTKISALIIIAIALYLISKKFQAYKQSKKVSAYKFSSTPHVQTCVCPSCKVDKNTTDMALIISAGIIPCPGTVTIFIFSLSLGLYYAGFLSALVMSLGMSTIIFFSALLSVAIRRKTAQSSSRLKKYLEYASLTLILLLGILLLFA